jgi:hypothetical protein
MACLNTSRKFRIEKELMYNSESYNRTLNRLYDEMSFQILNFRIHIHYFARDKIHIDL